MSTYESRFRPWLDDLGSWPDWQLQSDESSVFVDDIAVAGQEAANHLTELYGSKADVFGAGTHIEDMASQLPDEEAMQAMAIAIAACDHYNARVTVPRVSVGGLTNSANSKRWQTLRPYLVKRCQETLCRAAAQSMLWRSILARMPDNWLPTAQLTRALRRQLDESGMFKEFEVALDLKAPVPGGERWIAMQCAATVAALRTRLKAREACLVELIRDPGSGPLAAQFVVVYRMHDEIGTDEETGSGRVTLSCYEPTLGGAVYRLQLALTGERVVFRSFDEPRDVRPAVKALRLVALDTVEPPLFGWRRRLRAILPWRPLWWVKRVLLLFVLRERERCAIVETSDEDLNPTI